MMGPIERASSNSLMSLYAMFAAFKSGNTNVFTAAPAIFENGNLLVSIDLFNAKSACIGPSTAIPGKKRCIIFTALLTFWASSFFDEPKLEYDSMATLGLIPNKVAV